MVCRGRGRASADVTGTNGSQRLLTAGRLTLAALEDLLQELAERSAVRLADYEWRRAAAPWPNNRRVEIRLLGPFEVRDGGRVVALPRSSRRSVTAPQSTGPTQSGVATPVGSSSSTTLAGVQSLDSDYNGERCGGIRLRLRCSPRPASAG